MQHCLMIPVKPDNDSGQVLTRSEIFNILCPPCAAKSLITGEMLRLSSVRKYSGHGGIS